MKNKKKCSKCIYYTKTMLSPRKNCLFGLQNDICEPEYIKEQKKMKDKDFYKQQIQGCLKDIRQNKWEEKDYNTLIGYCNLIIANILEIKKEQK